MNIVSENLKEVVQTFDPTEKIHGYSYGEWTTKWWEWALSVPESNNPLLDDTGIYANINQNEDVWFLAGTIGDENTTARRFCIVPKNKSILFPIINYIHTEDRPFNMDKLIEVVKKDIDDIVVKVAVVDGCQIPIHRVMSDPALFSLKVGEENRFGFRVGIIDASADGYWVFIKALKPGKHEIYFHGACSEGKRTASAHYEVIAE